MIAVVLRHGPPFFFFGVLYFAGGFVFPACELVRFLRSPDSAIGTAQLPVALSCAFCLCLTCIAVLLWRVGRHYHRSQAFVWKRRKTTLPRGFFSLQAATAMAEA